VSTPDACSGDARSAATRYHDDFGIRTMTFTSAARRLAAPALLFCAAGAHAAPCPADAPRLVISHAGSLTSSFAPVEALFTQRTGVCIVDLSGGSVKLARDLAHGLADESDRIDIVAGADAEINDRMLAPAGLVTGTIRFAEGAMVLAYTTASKGAATIAAPAAAGAVPQAAADWATQLTRPGVTIGGSHPFLDPGGYRADMVFQLAQLQTQTPTPELYNELLTHFTLTRPGDILGKSFDYQLTYEHSARAAQIKGAGGSYRYVQLPAAVNLGDAALAARYAAAGVTMPGLDGPRSAPVRIPATRVTWGLSIVAGAPHRAYAEQFLQLFFSPEGVALRHAGPTPIDPPRASRAAIDALPASLRGVVRVLPAA
jgi:ABC-type molybdate transport system substrate-binding protein